MPHFNDKDFKLGHYRSGVQVFPVGNSNCRRSGGMIVAHQLPKGSNENTTEREFHNHYMHTAHGKHRATSGDIETGQ